MYDKTQLMKGVLEGCVLKIINSSETYGYDIVLKLQQFGFKNISEGTVYPVLARLEKKDYLKSKFKPSPLGPARKYYSVTEAGKALLNEFILEWSVFSKIINTILNKEEK